MRKQLRRLIPRYAAFPLMMTGVMNLFAYQLPKLFQLFLDPSEMHDMTTSFDAATPFLPGWVWVYVATFVFWTYQNVTVAQESPEAANRLFAADFPAHFIFLFDQQRYGHGMNFLLNIGKKIEISLRFFGIIPHQTIKRSARNIFGHDRPFSFRLRYGAKLRNV